jgi:ectoine hydroxylase-related dioxygenase (phytanoyl-CoA dioxygenase family)
MSASTAATTHPNLDPATNGTPRIEVPKPLGESQIQSYMEQGYLIVSGVISRDEIGELLADTLKLLRGGYECPVLAPLSESMSDEAVMRSFLGIMQPHYISPVMLTYVKHSRICGMLSQLIAAHVPYWDGSVKCMQSMIFTKPPDYPGQAWHQDELYIPTRDRSLAGAWIALDDATVENGCLYVISQSHRMGYLYPQEPHDRPGEWDFAPLSYGFDDSGAMPVEVKAGDVIFFHGYILHCSYKNRSQMYRRAMVNHYCNAWSLLPWRGKADDRCIVPVAGIDPYAWKGYEALSPDQVWIRPLEQKPS